MKKLLLVSILFLLGSPFLGQNFTSSATVDQTFCGNSVIVVMSKTNSGGTSRVQSQMAVFDMIEHVSVHDLTAVPEIGTLQATSFNAETLQQIFLLEFENDNKQNVLNVIEQLRFVPGVYYAAPNYFRELTSRTPNDQFFNDLWGMQNIQAPQAWAITTGSRHVRVGIIDIGFQSHYDLNANIANGWCFFSNQMLTLANLGTTLPTTHSTGSHGNHVAGTIGAVGNNSIGVVGVNWDVSLVPLEVFTNFNADDRPVTTDARMIQAITWARNNNLPIINMSLGGFGTATTVRAHIQNNFPGLVTWAAGNSATNIDNNISGSGTFNIANIIGVGAIGPTNQRASYSCFGPASVSIYAPGGDREVLDGSFNNMILSTTLDNWYGWAQGTSMAAPHVAGVAALLLSIDPNLTGAQLKNLILEGSLPINIQPPTGLIHQSRRLNALGALFALTAEPATVPYLEEFESTTGSSLPLGWTSSSNAWIGIYDSISGISGTVSPRRGERQMARSWQQAGDFAWTFSQPVQLNAGATYTVSFWYRAPGWQNPNDASQLEFDDFKAQIGPTRLLTGTGASAQMTGATTIVQVRNQRVQQWTEATIQFTPATSGQHYIGFQCMTATRQGLVITIDDISITESSPSALFVSFDEQKGLIRVYPNPFTDDIHIVNAEVGQMLYIITVGGAVVHAQRITSQNETIRLGHLPAGTYILRVGEQAIRIVKQ